MFAQLWSLVAPSSHKFLENDRLNRYMQCMQLGVVFAFYISNDSGSESFSGGSRSDICYLLKSNVMLILGRRCRNSVYAVNEPG